MHSTLFISAGAVLLSACASTTPGARPFDMSAADHAAAASSHEGEAAAHAAAYDPDASSPTTPCSGRGAAKYVDFPCWTSPANPTAKHSQEAEAHRKMAAEHRAASTALRDAEARACVGLANADRDESPFAHRDDIASMSRLDGATSSGKSSSSKLAGGTVVLRAVPGLTKEYLQRVVDCHLARNASMGFAMPEMAFCPLAVQGARATVVSSGAGFGVEIRADGPDAASEVLKRARALVPGT